MTTLKLSMFILLYAGTLQSGHSQAYDTIKVGFYSSVNLIFDSPVERWDMGLGAKVEEGREVWDVLVRSAGSNRIKLAAGIKDFITTNLFVETKDAYYNFILKYEEHPRDLLIKAGTEKASILKEDKQGLSPIDTTVVRQENKFLSICQKVVEHNIGLLSIGQKTDAMAFYIGGIFLSGEHLYFKVHIRNEGTIPYDLGYTGFFIGDKGRGGHKRKPVGLEEVASVYSYRSDHSPQPEQFQRSDRRYERIDGGEMLDIVYVFRKFTLAKGRKLYIQFWEGNGGERKVELVVRGKDLLKGVVEI